MSTRSVAAALCVAVAALAGSAVAQAGVRVGMSGWSWSSPSPTGSTITQLGFDGSRGYAGGAFGTLLRTDDAGATWVGLSVGRRDDLTALQVVSRDVVVIATSNGAQRSVDGGATFSRLNHPRPRCCAWPADVAFTDATTGGVLYDDGTVHTTTDGGERWSRAAKVPGDLGQEERGTATALTFLTPTTGIATTTLGHIYRTTDGGRSWALASAAGRAVHDVTFADATHGVAVGAGGLFLVSADGGATWSPRETGAAGVTLATVQVASALAAIAVSERGDVVLRTTDGGASFTRVPAMAQPVKAVGYASPQRVVVAGAAGAMAVSGDGGASFAPLGGQRLTGRFFSLRGAPGGGALAVGEDGALARTTDRGRTWTGLRVPTDEDLVDVSFETARTGYAIDAAGRLFRSGDAGVTWAARDTGTRVAPRAVHAAGDDVVLLVGPVGLRRSADGAVSFSAVRGIAGRARLSDIDEARNALFVSGTAALLRSLDRGRTWTRVRLPSARTRIMRTDFVTARAGYLIDVYGRMFRTTDGGRRWRELLGLATDDVYGLSFSSATHGFAVRSDDGSPWESSLMRTTDGGRTWSAQVVAEQPIRGYGVLAGATSYVLAGTNSLLSSSTGGSHGKRGSITITASRTRLGRPGTVRVTVRAKGRAAGEVVTIVERGPGGSWGARFAGLDRTGRGTAQFDLNGTTTFVAQLEGDETYDGIGSPPVTVRVGR